jgi:hypothetical protein
MGRIESMASNGSSIVACITVAVDTRLPHRCLAMATFIISTITAFSHHVTILEFLIRRKDTNNMFPRLLIQYILAYFRWSPSFHPQYEGVSHLAEEGPT